jgi:DNA-binding transcriptional ArsR family regulator
MVKSKTELFDTQMQQCSELFKALSHPARIAILKYLADTKTCITGDISEELPLSRSTVNQHLAELKKAGLIQGSIDGAKTKYCLDSDNLQKFRNISTELFNQLQTQDGFKC